MFISCFISHYCIVNPSNLNCWFLSTTSAKWSKVYSDKRSGSESGIWNALRTVDYLIMWVSSPQNCNNWIERQMSQQCSC